MHKEHTNFHKDLPTLLEAFEHPGRAYRGKPFWAWNGELEKDELIRQARIMKEMGLGGFFMHARAGLITEYLGREWFELTNAVADEAKRLDMEAWLYDEDRWPSGSAGGKVTADPQYRMKSLVMTDMPADRFHWTPEVIAAFLARCRGIALDEYCPLSPGAAIPQEEGLRVLQFSIVPDPCSSGYNGATYLDTMSRAATERFIELTHEAYRQRCGDRIGDSIEGIFTDEPHRGHGLDDYREQDGVWCCSMAWTGDLFEQFRLRYGYDLKPLLPEVFYRYRGEKVSRVRIHYFDLADNLFLERFAMPIHQWCQAHNMRFTGHVLHEDALSNQTVAHGSLMRFYAHMDDPGVDVLADGDRCYWIVKQLSSAARQLGKRWLLSELYGCTGWQMSFSDYKAVGDWQALFGINLRCPHLSWYTMEGESKRDYPASILHQSSWYKDFARLETYFARFGTVISEGDPVCGVLVVNPIESAWALAHAGWSKWLFATDPDVLALEDHYARLFHMLAGRQIDFDYGEEQMMAGDWSVESGFDGPQLRIGQARYRCVVVSGAITLRPSTLDILRAFLDAGGHVVFSGPLPAYVDGLPSQAPRELLTFDGAQDIPFDETALAQAIDAVCPPAVRVTSPEGHPLTHIFCQVRHCPASGMSFAVLLNVDREHGVDSATLHLPAFKGQQIQLWDLMTGARYALGTAGDTLNLSFAPGQERVLAFTGNPQPLPAPLCYAAGHPVLLDAPIDYALDEPNVLVLDTVSWRWENGPWHGCQEVLKADQQVRDELGLEHRGGEMLQPWFAKLHDTHIYGRLQLSYRFTVEEIPQDSLWLCCERPEHWTVAVNGVPLSYNPADGFWIDICLKRLHLPKGLLKAGENEILLTGDFARTTNLEALYLTGSFGVSLDGERTALCRLPEQISLGNLADNRLPFYSGRITYRFTLPECFSPGQPLRLSLEDLHGALALIQAGGVPEQAVWTAPYEADLICPPDRMLAVTLVATRRNTFGPLHQLPVLTQSYGPGSFITEGKAWSDCYELVDCRLGTLRISPLAHP